MGDGAGFAFVSVDLLIHGAGGFLKRFQQRCSGINGWQSLKLLLFDRAEHRSGVFVLPKFVLKCPRRIVSERGTIAFVPKGGDATANAAPISGYVYVTDRRADAGNPPISNGVQS